MRPESLIGAPVALSAPDGRVFRFHVAALVPFEGETYAVLEQDGEDSQMLVTLVEIGEDHIPAFVIQGEEKVITGVMETLVARSIFHAMDEEETKCACGHHHEQGHDCSCGHHHHHHSHDCHSGRCH